MSENFIKDAKNFTFQMKVCSIICWVATLLFMFLPKTNNADSDWVIIPIGGVIFSIIYFSMNANIKKYEQLNNKK